MSTQIVLLAAPAFVAIGLTYLLFRNHNSERSFFVADRTISTTAGALTIASAWTWVVALFFIPSIAARVGFPALIPFVLVNAGVLAVFAYFAPRIRQAIPYGYTLPQFIGERDGKVVERVFAVLQVAILTYIVVLPLAAASNLVLYLADAQLTTTILILGSLIYIVAWPRGLRSSIVADVVKMAAIGTVILCSLIAIAAAGGISTIIDGLMRSVSESNPLLDMRDVWNLVLPASAALFAAVMMDGMLYQRLFALREESIRRAFLWGGFIFFWIVLTAASVGLLASGAGIVATNPDLVLFTTITHFVPEMPVVLFALILVTAILATAVAALNAAGSIAVKNFLEPAFLSRGRELSDWKKVQLSRVVMLAVLVVAGWAVLAKWELLTWWLTAGAIRSVLIIPLIALVVVPKEKLSSVLWWIIVSAGVAFTVYLYLVGVLVPELDFIKSSAFGEITQAVHRSAVDKVILVGLVTGLVCWGVEWLRGRMQRAS